MERREPRPPEDETLDEFIVVGGDTLRQELTRLARKMRALGPRVTIIDVVVNRREDYERVFDAMKSFLGASEILEARSSDYDEFRSLVSGATKPVVFIRDEVTRKAATGRQWVHSQDQGFKESAPMRAHIESAGKQIVLARYWDRSDATERDNVLTLDDFRDLLVYRE